MKTQQIMGWAGAICILLLVGCGPSHSAVRMLEAGRTLHLTVELPDDEAAGATGTIYYSIPALTGTYASRPLQLQGTNLVATLETQDLGPGQKVAYYFDVFARGEATSLGSAQKPYITEILDRSGLVQRSIRCGVTHTHADTPVVFTLDTGSYRASRAVVRYSPPDLTGVIEQVMKRKGGKWTAEVPANRVVPGAWTYRIETEIEGTTYTHPNANGDMATFTLTPKKK